MNLEKLIRLEALNDQNLKRLDDLAFDIEKVLRKKKWKKKKQRRLIESVLVTVRNNSWLKNWRRKLQEEGEI